MGSSSVFMAIVRLYWALFFHDRTVYNYPPKGRWIVVDMYRDAKRWGIYPPLFTTPEGDSCFSIYQIRWIKKRFFNFFFWNFRETTHHFSLRPQNSEYPRIFLVTGANQNVRKLLSADLVNTNNNYFAWGCQQRVICSKSVSLTNQVSAHNTGSLQDHLFFINILINKEKEKLHTNDLQFV